MPTLRGVLKCRQSAVALTIRAFSVMFPARGITVAFSLGTLRIALVGLR
jgi:hypothetical protein